MRSFFALWRKELVSYLYSPAAYVCAILFLVVTGFSFWVLALVLAEGSAGVNILQALFESLFFWMAQLVLVPVITMRLFAEENRTGTIELLMTAPVSDTTVVLAKFLGALCFYGAIWLPTACYLVILNEFSPMTVSVDPGPVATGYLGILLIGSLFIAVGLLASSLTRSQVLAALAGFTVFGLFFFAGLLDMVLTQPWAQELSRYVSAYQHMADFASGVVDTRPVVFYLSSTALVLFAAVKVVESRKWK